MPNPEHWGHELVPEADGTFRLEILDEWEKRVPVARQLNAAQAQRLLAAIEQEAGRRRYAVAEIIRDPRFMARTVLAIKRGEGE